jgi:ATP-dependent DNA helicase Rep
VRDFVGWLGKKGEEEGKSLLELTQSIALISMLDKDASEQDAVQLATLHASKGLEFGHVFLAGVEEGILPHRESQDDGKMEEERRLMYVGITRAQKSLHLSYCARRKLGKEVRHCEPSRFIEEMSGDGADIKKIGGKDAEPTKEAGRAGLAAAMAVLGLGGKK